MERLEILNAAARRICDATPAGPAPLVLQRPAVRWSWREFLGYDAGAGAFGVVFGGSLLVGGLRVIGGVIYLWSRSAGSTGRTR